MKIVDQLEAGRLFEKYAMLNGITEAPHVRTQRKNLDFYEIPGMVFPRQSWLVYELGDRKNEIALSLIADSIENGWDGQPESELKSLQEFFGKPQSLAVRWKAFLSVMAV